MGNLYLGDIHIETDSMYLGDVPLFEEGEKPIFIDDDGKKYYEEDCHIFVANDQPVNLACNGQPIFVAVNGVEKNYETEVKGKTFEDLAIHAIFDWDNSNEAKQDWFSDILQFGSRSIGGEPEGYKNPDPLPSERIPNQLKSGYCAFYYLQGNPTSIINLDVSNVKDMNYMLYESRLFNQDIGEWDVSSVKSMIYMFYKAYSFNQPIGEWNVSSVENMRHMFYKSSFNQPIGEWDVSSVENMALMFYDDKIINQPIGEWNVSNVKDMNNMFGWAADFNQDLSKWCVSNVTNHTNFDTGANAWKLPRPVWGTCPPRVEDGS